MIRNHGFTIVEIMIVLAVLSVSVFLSAEVLNQMNRSIKYPEAQVNLGAISTVIRETLKYQVTCLTAVSGASGISAANIANNTQEIQLSLPGILADGTPADDLLAANAIIQQLEITNIKLKNSVLLAAGKYFSEVELSAKVRATGLQLRPIISGGFYYTVVGTAITSCDTPSQNPVPLCREMGCTWDPALTPACQCAPIDLSCPAQKFITKIDNAGVQTCTPLGAGPCPGGTYLRGVSIGANDCVAMP